MWKAFDGSLVTTVCRSSLARKILCNNKCEGCWWEAEGGVHFSPFLLFFFFFFVGCFVTAEPGIYKMTQKSHRPGQEWGSKKTMKNALCIFSNIWSLVPMNVVFWCPMSGPAKCQPQQCHRRGHTKLLSSVLVKMRSVVRTGKDENVSFELEVIGTYSVFSFQADTSLTWKNEDTWISKQFEMVGLQGKTHSCLQGDWVPEQIHRNSIEILF